MIRTKHLVVSTALTFGALLGVVAFMVVARTGHTFTFIPEQQALLIESSETEREVVVVEDTTREDMRRSLVEKLQSYEDATVEQSEADEEEPSSEATTLSETLPPETNESKALFCEGGAVVGGGITSWGPVNASIVEGARVIASLARDMSGMPFYTLQLPLTPDVSSKETCLPRGMIGVALDGRIIESDTPFNASREGLVGYALDGFGIYGSIELSVPVDTVSLDRCHGHMHSLMQGGEVVSMYHYHATEESPYTLGCFKGEPVAY